MKIAVLGGGGAMGGIFGAKLAEAGHDVTLIDVNRDAVNAINANGLKIDAKDGSSKTYKVRASAAPGEVGAVDLVMNFVKCYHTEAAVTSARPMMNADTAVLTLQNGWGNAPKIAAIVGEDRVLVGLTYHSGTLLAPGHVKHPGIGMTFIGEPSGGPTARLKAIAAAFRQAQFDITESDSIMTEVWKKLCLNVCTLPTSALLRFFAHELVAYDGVKREMAALLKEAVAVGQAQKIAIDHDERWAAITSLLEKAIGGKASMLQDVEAGRRTEIDVINGAIVDAGKRLGVATPHNDAMVWMVKSLEAKYLSQSKVAA
jgi:2-dehydropantoate 2-reductase